MSKKNIYISSPILDYKAVLPAILVVAGAHFEIKKEQ